MKPSSDHQPPRWVRIFFSYIMEPRLLESSLGDLEEKFHARLLNGNPLWKAQILYAAESFGFLRMARWRHRHANQTSTGMIRHTLLFYGRLVHRDKQYYGVSLFGLAISLASFLLISLYIIDELSFDKFHENRLRLFRLTTHIKLNDVSYDEATSQFPAAAAVKSEFPEVEETVRLFPQDLIVQVGERKWTQRIVLADTGFFNAFTFTFVEGDGRTAMSEPYRIIFTRKTAAKYFGAKPAIGKTVLINGQSLIVSGVIRDVPEQSHLKFDAVVPLTYQLNSWKSQTGLEGRENKWFWTGAYTYLLLKPSADASSLQAKLPALIDKYFPERFKKGGRYELQPLTDIHLTSHLDAELEPGGSLLYVRLFSVVALVIMLVSAINMINLSWFKIGSRIRELGVRKFLGQNTGRIVAQLSAESIFMGVASFVLAVFFCLASIGSFNLLVQKNIRLDTPSSIGIGSITFLLIVVIGWLAVIRPAYRYASQSSGILLLQNYRNASQSRFRNVLIGVQVCFSFVFLVFSFIVGSQIAFFKNSDLGFDKDNIVVVSLVPEVNQQLEAFKTELKKNKSVLDVAGGDIPGNGYNAWRFVPQGGSYEKPLMFPYTAVDYDFLNTLDIKILAGENFRVDGNYDSLLPYIINKRAAVELGWLDDPIGRTMEIFAPGTTEIMAKGRIIALIEDYHFESLHRPVKPVVITVGPYFATVLIKLSVPANATSLSTIAAAWKKFSDKPFTYEMMDKSLDKLYTNETQLSNIILFFTFVALYLTCYGLFSMSSLLFSARLKEVAIRKVFGADRIMIVKELYSRYAAFNLLAIAIGLPLAAWIGDLWLQTFTYRIDLTWDLFAKAGACVLMAGLVSVSYYLASVAWSNPVKFLRRD